MKSPCDHFPPEAVYFDLPSYDGAIASVWFKGSETSAGLWEMNSYEWWTQQIVPPVYPADKRLTVRERIAAFCEQYPQTEFGQEHIVFSPQSLTDHNIDGTLAALEKRNFPAEWWGEQELHDTETLLRELRAIPEAQRLSELCEGD